MEQKERLMQLPERLLNWYDQNARVLPWREHPSPYRVWVSEIMLQQTRVKAVTPYFDRFIREFPNIQALAEAPEERLLKLWEGLGYYNRIRNLQKAAQIATREYGGELPQDYRLLCGLPGIGAYTAGAILSIAYQKPYPAVDGNVLRVISRLLCCYDNLFDASNRKKMTAQIQEILPEEVGAFNQALMELGAVICRPNGEPLCECCPVAEICLAKQNGVQSDLPVKPKKGDRRKEKRTVLLLFYQDRVLLRQRPEQGLLAKLWEYPNELGWWSGAELDAYIAQKGLCVSERRELSPYTHIFTHIEWDMKGFALILTKAPSGHLVDLDALDSVYSVPNAFLPYTEIARNYLEEVEISKK